VVRTNDAISFPKEYYGNISTGDVAATWCTGINSFPMLDSILILR